MTTVSPHAHAESRSLTLHRAVAGHVRADPTLLTKARERVASWQRDGSVHPHYCAEWNRVLAGSVDDVAAFLEADDERARALRQTSPFAGVLTARERWQLLR